ncbi:tape measure protein [uncultured Alistipes sp.]|uniref:tape measure protein n=1 Tax=uncultured Alistipes sp. TaxID=538949 RepID=UPI00262C3532|nr:tape measure protein [uncultured Alistipes sp.]
MAEDRLIFPVGFDLEKGVKEAQKDVDGYLRRIAKAVENRPISVKFQIDKDGGISGTIKRERERATRELTGLKKEMAEITRQWDALSARDRGGDVGARLIARYRELTQEAKGHTSTLSAAVKYEDRLARQRERSANAAARAAQKTREYNGELKSQDGYVSRLIKRLTVYASFRYAGQFLTSIRDVTAEFELQRVSLGAIIQDQERANQLFSEIKSFALQSPLKILDLTKYTKQVAAYGIETEKLFGTTKMLADISVGLGVSLDRLALFYGQVFATGYLRASEVRQATEAGIPLVDKLAKKLSEANGKLVSAAEVMDLISKRAISFEQVEAVFKDMTSAGGEFYNMQVKQSQTLFGMWSKLGDAAAIMYDQIGNTATLNAAMKTSIGILESMMRNWKTTARVLDSISVALAVYVVGLKNAAIASKAVTSAEAQRLAVEKGHLVVTPKAIAAIIGKGNALYLSIRQTNLHTAAMDREAAATNILTKGFWKLTAAMLANPWVAAATGVALVATALFHFIGNAETAAERAEKLNNSVASLKNLHDTTKPLIDTYNNLIVKTKRTAAEQKKLSEVTHELAKQYPEATTSISNFGEQVELSAYKLSKLYQAEKQARMDNTRYELEQTEKKIKDTESAIEQYQKQLASGTKSIYKQIGSAGQYVTLPLTMEDKGGIILNIDELRKNLTTLKKSADEAKDSLDAAMRGITVEELRIERFNAWKKKLAEFSKEVGGIKVRLFDDSTIDQFGTLEQALDAAAKKYDESSESVEKYKRTLEAGLYVLGKDQFDKISAERDAAQATKELSEEMLNYYNAMSLVLKSMGSSGQSDPRLGILREMVSTLKQVNKEYDDLAKNEGVTKALADTQEKYTNTFKYLQSLATKYKFELPDFGVPTDAASLAKYLDAIKTAMAKLPKSEKAVLSLETEVADINMADAQRKIEAELKELADRISRTKTAKEFYEKILSQTGDVELAANVAIHVYGEQGKDLNKQIKEQIEKLLEPSGIRIDANIFRLDGTFDSKKLREFAEAQKDALGGIESKAYQELIKLSDNADKDFAKTIDGWLKAIEKAKTASDKMLDLARTTRTEIDKIQAQKSYAQTRVTELLGLGTRTDKQKEELENLQGFLKIADNLIQGFKDKQAKEQSSLEYEMFKDSPMYVQMFDDLDHASTRMLENMKSRMEALKGEWQGLSPTQLKELQSRMNEIDAQLTQRNPFKTLASSIKEYRRMMKEGDSRGNKSAGAADADLMAASKVADEARKKYDELVKKYGEGAEKSVQEVIDAKNELDRSMANEEAAQKAVENWKKVKDMIGLSANELFQMMDWGADIARGIADISEAMGADEEDVQYWNDVADALGQISSGIQDIVSAAMSGNVVGIISATLTAIPKMFVGFANLFSAGKIKRANKEIRRQAEMLEQLEYTYGRLEKAAEKLFGTEYLQNYNQQIKNLQAQQQAYMKQAQAERSKGKKADKDKIKEYENQARDTADKIKEMQNDLVAQIVGTDVASAARDFANAWLDAYLSFGSTTDAIKEKFDDMTKNMTVNMVLAQVVKSALQPIFDMIDELAKDGVLSAADIEKVMSAVPENMKEINDGLGIGMEALKAAGVDISKLREGSSEFSGIAKNVSNTTSEEINANTAALNTQNYYMSHVPQIAEHVAVMRQLMERGTTTAIPEATAAGWTDWQKQAMDNYNAIARNTAETVAECRRSAAACEAIAEKIGRVVVNKGGRFGVNSFLNS